jgi:hypothetical protein
MGRSIFQTLDEIGIARCNPVELLMPGVLEPTMVADKGKEEEDDPN